jgi:hypothetical protein
MAERRASVFCKMLDGRLFKRPHVAAQGNEADGIAGTWRGESPCVQFPQPVDSTVVSPF